MPVVLYVESFCTSKRKIKMSCEKIAINIQQKMTIIGESFYYLANRQTGQK